MALILARLLATTTSRRLWEVRTGILRSLLSPISLLVRALGLRLLSSQATRSLRGPHQLRCALAMGEPITFMEQSTSVWLLSWPECTEYIQCGSSCVPAVSPRLGCRWCPRAVVALFPCVCSSYTCARCAGWGAAASLRNFWLRQCRLALRPRLCCLALRIASREVPLLVLCVSQFFVLCLFLWRLRWLRSRILRGML